MLIKPSVLQPGDVLFLYTGTREIPQDLPYRAEFRSFLAPISARIF
jgi:hypothetical protein